MEFVEERRTGLDRYLQTLLAHEQLRRECVEAGTDGSLWTAVTLGVPHSSMPPDSRIACAGAHHMAPALALNSPSPHTPPGADCPDLFEFLRAGSQLYELASMQPQPLQKQPLRRAPRCLQGMYSLEWGAMPTDSAVGSAQWCFGAAAAGYGVCSDAWLAWCVSSCSCSSQKSDPPKQQQQQQQQRAARPEQQQQRRQQQQQPTARPEQQQQQPQPALAQRQQEVAADQRLEEQQEGQERGRQQRGVLGGLSRAVLESTQSMGRGLSSATGAVADLASAASGGVAKAANGVADAAGAVVGVLTAPLQGSDGTELCSGALQYTLLGMVNVA